jgi:hypothetical protein
MKLSVTRTAQINCRIQNDNSISLNFVACYPAIENLNIHIKTKTKGFEKDI